MVRWACKKAFKLAAQVCVAVLFLYFIVAPVSVKVQGLLGR